MGACRCSAIWAKIFDAPQCVYYIKKKCRFWGFEVKSRRIMDPRRFLKKLIFGDFFFFFFFFFFFLRKVENFSAGFKPVACCWLLLLLLLKPLGLMVIDINEVKTGSMSADRKSAVYTGSQLFVYFLNRKSAV